MRKEVGLNREISRAGHLAINKRVSHIPHNFCRRCTTLRHMGDIVGIVPQKSWLQQNPQFSQIFYCLLHRSTLLSHFANSPTCSLLANDPTLKLSSCTGSCSINVLS